MELVIFNPLPSRTQILFRFFNSASPPQKKTGPLHFTATSEPTAINAESSAELTPKAFADCKDRMRAVKKSLKHLDSQDPNLSEKEQLEQTRKYV